MIKIEDHDVVKTKEGLVEENWQGYSRFRQAHNVTDYPIGSIFLTLRRRKTVNLNFGGRSFKKEFEEIALAPDGKIGIIDRIQRTRIA